MSEDNNKDYSMSDGRIMAANGLMYKMPQELSTTVNKTLKKQYAQRQSYSAGQTVIFDFNTGSDYVDPSNCMLRFDFTLTADGGDPLTGANFGSNSAAALIQEIRILSKNGCEVDRIQSANVLSKIIKDYCYSEEGEKMLEMAGFNRIFIVDTAQSIVIPMGLISGFFRPIIAGMKIPAGLASGLRIELTLAQPSRALRRTGGTGTNLSYNIDKVEMLTMCHSLNDPTQAVLMQNSSQSGLQYSFRSYFHSPVSTTSLAINEQVKKAVSRCNRIFCSVYDSDLVVDETQDGFASVNGADNLADYQFRVGSSYYPKESVNDLVTSWYVTETCFDKIRDIKKYPSNVSLNEYNDGKFTLGVSIENDDRLNLSGIALNNSNVAELRLNLKPTNPAGGRRDIDLYIEYVSITNTFINKTSIKI